MFSSRRIPGARKGALLDVHLKDDSTVQGSFVDLRRGFLRLVEYRIQANGALHEMKGVCVVVPFDLVKMVEVKS